MLKIKGSTLRRTAQNDRGGKTRPSINELYHTAYDYVKRCPSAIGEVIGTLHQYGPATAEAPYINASETRPLEAGMILAMEVPCYIDGVNGFNIEDMVLITEDDL